MNIKFGVHSLLWCLSFSSKYLPVIDIVKEMGFDLLEVEPGDEFRNLPPEELRNRLDTTGLEVSLSVGLDDTTDISSPDENIREQGIAFMQDNIDWAKRIGAGIIVGPVYAEIGRKRYLSDEKRKDEWNRAAESLRQLGDYAAEKGIIIALEPLNRFETDMINTAEQAVDMCDQVDSPSVKITLDTFHMNIEEKDLAAAIRASKKHLVHLHTCANDRGVPGEDHIQWLEIREALRDIDYEGYAVIESFKPGQIAAFACIWRDLAPSIEDIPRKGLSFLRNLLTS